jgi:hypothetical protein
MLLLCCVVLAQPEPWKLGEMPDLVGRPVTQADAQLGRLKGLAITRLEVVSDQPVGAVVGQVPKAGSLLVEGCRVSLRVSSGPSKAGLHVVETPAPSEPAGPKRSSVFLFLQLLAALIVGLAVRLMKPAPADAIKKAKKNSRLSRPSDRDIGR